MAIYKFPNDAEQEPGKEQSSLHQPEFIEVEEIQEGEEIAEEYMSKGQMDAVHLPFLLRIFTFAVSCTLFAGSFLLLCFSSVMAILTLATFISVPAITRGFLLLWRYTRRMFTTALGFIIMCFSPALGMGFLGLYFALQGESAHNSFIHHFIKTKK